MSAAALASAWALDARLTAAACHSAERQSFARQKPGHAAAHGPQGPGSADGAGGLVSSKTSADGTCDLPISTDPATLRDRRVRGLRRNVWAAGKLHEQNCPKGFRCWFVTLTYRGCDDWHPRHVSQALERFRHWCKLRHTTARYVWVAELQQRGALHYHLAIWLPAHLSYPMWDKPTRSLGAFWPHGMTNRQLARNAVGYLMKYMSKVGKHHVYPKHCRIYGAGGLDASSRAIRSWLNWPMWLKQLHGVGETVMRGGRRLVRETGEILCSPFQVVRRHGQLFLRTVGPVPARWVDGPYSALPA